MFRRLDDDRRGRGLRGAVAAQDNHDPRPEAVVLGEISLARLNKRIVTLTFAMLGMLKRAVPIRFLRAFLAEPASGLAPNVQ
jgi:hypothetical protein